MEGQARSALLVARSARNQQVSPSKILFLTIDNILTYFTGKTPPQNKLFSHTL
jgi:hypothetical protein